MAQDIAAEYKKYFAASVMGKLARAAHGDEYCGQTSSATFPEIVAALRQTNLPEKGTIFDAGCGNGCFALRLAEACGYNVCGVDLCAALIEHARASSERLQFTEKCQFYQDDFTSASSFKKKVDLVLCVGSLYWGPDLAETLANWKSFLHRPGHLVIFLNIMISPLNEQEQARVGKTSFIGESTLMDTLHDHEFINHVENGTEAYIQWLERWCRAIQEHRSQLKEEMGEVEAQTIKARFETYLNLALSGKVKRAIIISSLMQ